MLTVYYTRWWIRQRFTTMFLLIIDTTYSHYYWCAYVVYPNMMTIPGRCVVLEQGVGNTTFPRASRKALFFRKSKEKPTRNPRLQEVHGYKHCILKLHHNCKQKHFQSFLIMRDLILEKERLFAWRVIWFRRSDNLHMIWLCHFLKIKIACDLIMQLEKVWSDFNIYIPREKIKILEKKT